MSSSKGFDRKTAALYYRYAMPYSTDVARIRPSLLM